MEKLDEILAAHVAKGSDTKDKLLGAAFTVVNRDGVLYQGSAGRTDFPPESKPWRPDTVSWIASMTKLASAICVLQTVERGLVTLDEDVRPRVPFLAEVPIIRGFDEGAGRPVLEPNDEPITLRRLLTHTTGLAYDLAEDLLMRWRRHAGRRRTNLTWTEEGFSTPLLFRPGADWVYGTSVDWAAAVLEQATGQRLGAYMAENLLRPLGMDRTGFRPDPDAVAGIPARGPDGALADAPAPLPREHPVESGGAGLFSTAGDYAKLLVAVLQGRLLGGDAMELLFAPQLDAGLQRCLMDRIATAPDVFAPGYPRGTPANFALGGMVNLEDLPGKRREGSMMWSGYTNPHWWIDRKTGVAGVLQVSLLPSPDPVVIKLYDELERAVYGELLSK